MSTRNPAAARSSSDSAPQKPYSRFERAQSRQSASAGHDLHTDRACDSRTTRASGRSPAGAKNRRVCPLHEASAVQVSGPVKMKLDIMSAVMYSPSRPEAETDAREPGGGTTAPRAPVVHP